MRKLGSRRFFNIMKVFVLNLLSSTVLISLASAQAISVQGAPPPEEQFPDDGNQENNRKFSSAVFSGSNLRSESYFGYAGFIHATNGDLAKNGFLLRAAGLYNQYSYSSTGVPGGRVNADAGLTEALVGYQLFINSYLVRGFVGLDYEGHNLIPFNTYDYNGHTSAGIKLFTHFETPYINPFYAQALIGYGTAKDRLWSQFRTGYNFGPIIMGPEFFVMRNPASYDRRLGGFIGFRLPQLYPFEISISSGYSRVPKNRSQNSLYGTLEMSTAF
jgi:hypothetical protein